MKRLALLVIAAGLAWSAHWFWAAHNKRAAIEAWAEDRRAEGWEIAWNDLAVAGFPNRLDVTLDGLSVAAPGGGLRWQGDFLQILALSYQSGHEIVVFPPRQTIGTHEVTSEGLRASVVHDGAALMRLNLEAAVLNVEGPAPFAMAGVNAAILRQEDGAYRATLLADALARGNRALTGTAVPDSVDALRADTTWAFDRPLRLDGAGPTPQPTRMTLRLVEWVFGQLELRLAGSADIDDQGRLDGEITVRAENWRDILRLARDGGTLPEGLAEALEEGLGLVAALSGNRETLDLPLGFRQGRMSLGPIPLGDGPRLRLP